MANPKKGTSQARNEFIWGWAFILPTMLGLIILNIYPIFKTIYESFFKTGDFGKGNIFIGFDNYVKLFHDAEVWQAVFTWMARNSIWSNRSISGFQMIHRAVCSS